MAKSKRILDLINNPKDLHELSVEELEILAGEIREEIVRTTSKTGGHVSSSLGAVEIILAIHSLIDSPKDKVIFDVGHQAYAHKLITGRRDEFKTLRKFDGLSGFTQPCESEHDVHYSGHAADSLSVALGLVKAKKLKCSNEKIIAVIGDASIAGGMAFEAINNIGQEKLPLVIVLNNNKMSISESVGGVGSHLRSVRLHPQYSDAMNAIKYGLLKFGSVGEFAIKMGHASKESLKHFIMPNAMIFEELGITCLPAVDGHNIKALKESLKDALNYDGPVMVHAISQKGAGYLPAVKDPEKFHGIGKYNIKTGESKDAFTYSFTNAFTDAIYDLASEDKKVIALTAAMAGGTGLKKFKESFPDRFIDVGIAEEHLVGSAAGLAKAGYKPYVAIYSAFLQRAIDQMVTNVAIENLNVTFCIDRAGLVGADGPTHHGLFDIVYTKMIPNFTIIAPSCAYELKCALKTSNEYEGPFAIRYPKGAATEINNQGKILKTIYNKPPEAFEIGTSRTLKKGNDAAILAFGTSVIDALKAHEMCLKKGINCRVIDMRFVKPLDLSAIAEAANQTHKIVCVEEAIKNGGVGSSVLEELMAMGLCEGLSFINLGIDDTFVSHGKIDQLKTTAKIDSKTIYKAVVSLF